MSAPIVVFDLDGTLVDSAPDLIDSLNTLFLREGWPPLPADEARSLIGSGMKPLIARGLKAKNVDTDAATLEALYAEFVDDYASRIAKFTRPYPGVEKALDRLAAAGFRLAVCTNKLEWLAVKLLDALSLSDRFATICGQDTFGVPKPDPRALLRTIEASGGSSSRAVMVGDSATDVRTAQAASIPVVVVDFGYTEIPVPELGADHIISHYDALPDTVAKLVKTPPR